MLWFAGVLFGAFAALGAVGCVDGKPWIWHGAPAAGIRCASSPNDAHDCVGGDGRLYLCIARAGEMFCAAKTPPVPSEAP